MTRAAFYIAGAGAFILAGVFFLVKMGAPGWFTVAFVLAIGAATVLLVWPVLLAGAVAWVLWKVVAWRARRRGGYLP